MNMNMETNINIDINVELIKNQLSIPKNTLEQQQKDKNIIQVYDFFSINNINISEKLKQIPFYYLYFDLFTHYTFVKLGQIDKKYIENYENITRKKDEKYILFSYKKKEFIKFSHFFLHLPTPKLFVFYIINSYSRLLKNVTTLNNQKICFFNISHKNIVFDNGFKPILINFGESILIDKLDEEYLFNIMEHDGDYTLKPLELHVLFHLIKNNESTLSYSSVEVICDFFVKNNPLLSLFSLNYKNLFFQTCSDTLKKYINKPKNYIINDIIQYSHTWDNYSLSFLYLYFVGNINKTFSLKNCFLTKFLVLLNKNLHPDPLKRETIQHTHELFNKLFEDYSDWSFANTLQDDKYKKLLNFIY
jgi:hypothetical protein